MTNPFSTSLRAYHGDPTIKDRHLARVRAHAAADEIVHGLYWQNGKGCAIGCTIHSGDHTAYETEIGVPRILARLEVRLFETMPNWDAKMFPEAFLAAIPIGADLSMVWPKWAHWMLVDPECGMVKRARTDRARTAITDVAALYERTIGGDAVDRSEWTSARDAAYVAYAYAAAYAVDAYSSYADARPRFALAAARKLCDLLREAPVPEEAIT